MPDKYKKAAVITGDVIGSTKLTPVRRRKLQNLIKKFIESTSDKFPDFKAEQFRGDSIQAILTRHLSLALLASLTMQTNLISHGFGIRLSIGIGEISFKSKNVITSDGSAFQVSGTMIDEIKKRNEYISVASTFDNFNKEWTVHSATLNYILERLTIQQAQAVYLQMQNLTQEEIAIKLKISQPSVHQRLQAAGWPVINRILQRFTTAVSSL
ncbi:MAG: SatD family protein [Ilyomonas sp.]